MCHKSHGHTVNRLINNQLLNLKKKIKRPVGHFAHQDNNSQINFILSSFFTKFNAILYKSESIFSKKKNWIYSISMTRGFE